MKTPDFAPYLASAGIRLLFAVCLTAAFAGTALAQENGDGFTVNFDVLVLKQFDRDNPAIINDTNEPFTVLGVQDFEYDVEPAYRAEVGYGAENGWGVRVRYFFTEHRTHLESIGTDSTPFSISVQPLNLFYIGPGDPGDLVTYDQSLRMHVVDAEVTRRAEWGSWNATLAAGVRVADTTQRTTFEEAVPIFVEIQDSRQERTGVGPTVALDLKRKLGGSGVSFYARGRFAALFGDLAEEGFYENDFGDRFTGSRDFGRTTLVLEGETGLRFAGRIGGSGELFAHAGFVVHGWFGLVSAVPTAPVGGDAHALLDDPAQKAKTGNVGFYGGSFGFGFRF